MRVVITAHGCNEGLTIERPDSLQYILPPASTRWQHYIFVIFTGVCY